MRYFSKKRIWEFFLKEKFSLSFFTLAFIFFLIRGILLIYPDLNIAYPFLAPDSYDWIANGLHYEGYDVNFTFRPPGLSLIIALLDKFQVLNLLPFLNQLVLFGILLVLFRIITKQFGKLIATILTVILFFNFFLQNLSLYILADTYALLFLILGLYFYTKAEDDENKYIFASLFWSISFLFQYAVVFIIPAVLIHFFIFRKKIKLNTYFQISYPIIIFVGAWMIYKRIKLGSFLYSGVKQVELINLHFDSIFFYFINIIAVLGIFAFILLTVGILKAYLDWQRKKDSVINQEFIPLNLLIIVSWLIFWVLLYDWNDRRFIAYLLPFLVPLIAISIDFLLNKFNKIGFVGKICVMAIFLLSIIWSALPYESIFSFDELKITNSLTLKFNIVIDKKTFKGNIDAFSFHVTRDENGFNPINLRSISKLKNIDYSESNNLKNIQEKINSEKLDFLCIKVNNLDKSKLYILSNRYGNYFKMKVEVYPDCPAPNARIVDKRLELI